MNPLRKQIKNTTNLQQASVHSNGKAYETKKP